MMEITHPTRNTNFTFIRITEADSVEKSLSRTITMEEIGIGRH